MEWTFSTASQLRFGCGVSKTLASEIRARGTRVLVVTGANSTRHARLIPADGISVEVVPCAAEPDLAWLTRALETARAFAPEVVVGLGGGSAIDGAKAIAALVPNAGEPLRYLEVVGDGTKLGAAPLPMIAVPTTSGTGAEVTKNAVISVLEGRRKVSLRDDRMMPDLALVDPGLTNALPIHVTAATGLDALTQVVEPYLSRKANPMTDALCRDGISRAAQALPRLLAGEESAALREDMSLASVFGGMALANSGLGAVHGLAGVLGGWCGAPHGALCGRLLPWVLRTNALAGDAALRARFDDVSQWISGDIDLDGLIAHLTRLLDLGGVPTLQQMGVLTEDFDQIAEASRLSSSMKGNPVELSREDLIGVLNAAY